MFLYYIQFLSLNIFFLRGGRGPILSKKKLYIFLPYEMNFLNLFLTSISIAFYAFMEAYYACDLENVVLNKPKIIGNGGELSDLG